MLVLCLATLLAGSPPVPDAESLSRVQFRAGEEIRYLGEVAETQDRIDNRLKKEYDFAVTLLVLSSSADFSDLLVLTALKPRIDPVVLQATPIVERQAARPSFVRIELLRVDARGRASRLAPATAGLPLDLNEKTQVVPVPRLPLDAPPLVETGMLIPWPIQAVTKGSKWDVQEPLRPPVGWNVPGLASWNGGRCFHVTASQQSLGWDRPESHYDGWRRSESLLVPPSDGYAATVHRIIQRREGRDVVQTISVKYERQESILHQGNRLRDVQVEAERAWSFANELARLQQPGARTSPVEFQALLAKIDEHLETSRARSSFRASVESTKRLCEVAKMGSAPAVVIVQAHLPGATAVPHQPTKKLAIGAAVPDFVVADVDRPTGRFRLSSARGKPVLIGFYKPGSKTSRPSLQLLDDLATHFAGKLAVIPLACEKPQTIAAEQKKFLKVSLPVFQGDEVRKQYASQSYPHFLLVDPRGTLVWELEGCGNETGFLIRDQVNKLLGHEKQ